jgi:thiamine biosynthesis protein ThiS
LNGVLLHCVASCSRATLRGLVITLNGDRFELAGAVTVTGLLVQLDIDPRRVAVEHNTVVLKRTAFDSTVVNEGDEVEIVNFVGGG